VIKDDFKKMEMQWQFYCGDPEKEFIQNKNEPDLSGSFFN
jgi:hypothetical protein